MRNIVIIPNTNKDTDLYVTQTVINKLVSLDCVVYVDKKLLNLTSVSYYDSFPDFADLIVVIGGDGSVIDAAGYAVQFDIPIVGVNRGRVGYLTEVEASQLDLLDKIVTDEYYTEEKILLTVGDETFAINDVVISHSDYLGISDFRLVDSVGNSLNYRADGIIFATPQGSTAYSLSAGGPVVAHNVDSIIVTPICTHSFFDRTVVYSSSEVLTVTNTSSTPLNVSLDGRQYRSLEFGGSITIKKSNKTLKMLSFSQNSMFTELFRKMNILEGLK